jgi:hypothetical protein
MEVAFSSETFATIYQTTCRNTPGTLAVIRENLAARMRYVTEPNNDGMNTYSSGYDKTKLNITDIANRYVRAISYKFRPYFSRYMTNRWLGETEALFGRGSETSPLSRTELRSSSRKYSLY